MLNMSREMYMVNSNWIHLTHYINNRLYIPQIYVNELPYLAVSRVSGDASIRVATLIK